MSSIESMHPEKALVVRFSTKEGLHKFAAAYDCAQDKNNPDKYYLYLQEIVFTEEDLHSLCEHLRIPERSPDAFQLEDAHTLIAIID